MDKTPELPEFARGEATIEQILGQAFVALGQGTNGVRVSLEAVALARAVCRPVLEEVRDRWPQVVDAALEVVRTIGRVAAHLATEHGKTEIDWPDLLWAAAIVSKKRTSFPCMVLKRQLRRLGLTEISRPAPPFPGTIKIDVSEG